MAVWKMDRREFDRMLESILREQPTPVVKVVRGEASCTCSNILKCWGVKTELFGNLSGYFEMIRASNISFRSFV